uniref:Uncharacterized protein n=1 Tax=Ascaris lumbricoides TaxID=6252 RepID=A0A9J2Q3G0_ASCLU
MGELLCVLATLLLLVNPLLAISCYSCANDFIVWHWRHFFLKRNYGLTASDESCVRADYRPGETQPCPSTCFILYLNGTNRYNGKISVLGVGRGCSSQFLTNDQHAQLGLGAHSKVSEISNYLSSNFDMVCLSSPISVSAAVTCLNVSFFGSFFGRGNNFCYLIRAHPFESGLAKARTLATILFDITEHWCFCASDECNQQSCFSRRVDDYTSLPHKRRHYSFDNYWITNRAASWNYIAATVAYINAVLLIREFFFFFL